MLGKLMKHEWKAVWKVPTVLIIVLQVLAVFAGFTFSSPIWRSEMKGLDVLLVLIWMLFYFAVIGVNVGIMLFLAVRFYKNMFTDEGYLTHTLPVTTHQILISKILPMAVWVFMAMLGVILSLIILGSMGIMFQKPGDMSFWEFVSRSLGELLELLRDEGIMTNGIVNFVISTVFMMIISVFSGVMTIVGSISIGQMLGKHKVLGSIGAYFLISTVTQIVMSVALIPGMTRRMENANNVFEVLSPVYWGTGIFSILVSVALYFLSEFLIRRKLNLD